MGNPPPPPYNPHNGSTPLGVGSWPGAAPMFVLHVCIAGAVFVLGFHVVSLCLCSYLLLLRLQA